MKITQGTEFTISLDDGGSPVQVEGRFIALRDFSTEELSGAMSNRNLKLGPWLEEQGFARGEDEPETRWLPELILNLTIKVLGWKDSSRPRG